MLSRQIFSYIIDNKIWLSWIDKRVSRLVGSLIPSEINILYNYLPKTSPIYIKILYIS